MDAAMHEEDDRQDFRLMISSAGEFYRCRLAFRCAAELGPAFATMKHHHFPATLFRQSAH
jgi:hypothetical protein